MGSDLEQCVGNSLQSHGESVQYIPAAKVQVALTTLEVYALQHDDWKIVAAKGVKHGCWLDRWVICNTHIAVIRYLVSIDIR